MNSGLLQVADSGGTPVELTTPNAEKDEIGHRYPMMLPGGKQVLFQVSHEGGLQNSRTAILTLSSNKWHFIIDEESYYPHYGSTGHIMFVQAGMPMAVPFDLKKLEISGTPLPVLEDVAVEAEGNINFSFSDAGGTSDFYDQ